MGVFEVLDQYGNVKYDVADTASIVLYSGTITYGQIVTFQVPDIYTTHEAHSFSYNAFEPDTVIKYPTITVSDKTYTIVGIDSKPMHVYITGR